MRYLPILLTLLLMACSITTPPQMEAQPVFTGSQWYNSDLTYRLRHDGVLRLKDKTLPLSGFMVLNTAKRQAKVVLLTGLGIKLAALEVTPNSYTVISSSPVAERIPHFLEQCAYSIQQMFITNFPDEHPLPGLDFTIDHASGFVTGKAFHSHGEKWSAAYTGTKHIADTVLPAKIVFTNTKRDYQITLQLNDAKVE